MTRHVLVTGSNGFIGRHLCRLLHRHGYVVRTLNRHPDTHWPDSVALDLTSNDWAINPCDNIDTVFHLAGKAHALTEVAQDADEYRRIHVEGTRNLLTAAQRAGVRRFVLFSSVKAVGDDARQPMDESVSVAADTPYGRSKFEAEVLVLQGDYVPHATVIRPCMVYGNSDKGNLSRMIQAIRRGLFPPLPEMHNKRSMVHVEDVVQAALLAAESAEAARQIYIVSDGRHYSTREIYDWIRAALGKPPNAISIPLSWLEMLAKVGDRVGQWRGRRFFFDSDALAKLIGSAWYSSAKIERELGFKPIHDLPSALPEIVKYLEKAQLL
ncbi:MAG: SDR family oxidoreductase [Methylomicrobium sp.]